MREEKLDLRSLRFPKGLTRIYWYRGERTDGLGERDYEFVGRIKHRKGFRCVYYHAWHDYTGFDCQGSMRLHLSRDLAKLLYYGVPGDVRRRMPR